MSRSEPDLILVGGRVITMDPARPSAEAVAISRGRVTAAGSSGDIAGLAGPRTVVVRLQGMTVTPGFNDCHMHIAGLGVTLMSADLSPAAGVRSAETLVAALRTWANDHPRAAWVRGYGYNQNVFPSAGHIQRADLDVAFPDRPVVVFHVSGHAAVANSAALRPAEIGDASPQPSGGEIARDAAGRPTGLLLEAAIGLVTRVIPRLTRSERAEAVILACSALVRHGVTSASDMGVGTQDSADDIQAYLEAVERGAPLRMTLCPEAADLWEPDDIPCRDAVAADWRLTDRPDLDLPGAVRLGAAKLYADGALTTRTAALSRPYADQPGRGMLVHSTERLMGYVDGLHRAGWQIATHAIGDRAVAEVLRRYEAATGGATAVPEHRHRIEHAMLLDRALIGRIRRAGVVAVMQPEFIARLGDAYVLGLGSRRASALNPVRSLLNAGVTVAFSSDCPVVPGSPLDGIRAAASRTTPTGVTLGSQEACTAEEALRAYTVGAAYAVQDEAAVGRIAPGMRADMAVLTSDPLCDDLDDVEVAATMVGGKFVYGADALGLGCAA